MFALDGGADAAMVRKQASIRLPALGHPVQQILHGEDVAGRIDPLAVTTQRFAQASKVDEVDDRHGRQSICFRRSEEHTSELQSLMRISYAVFCLKKKKSH